MQAEAEAGTAKSTRVQLANVTQAAFAWLQDNGKILSGPARNIPIPNDGEADLPEPPLSEAEVHALLAGLRRDNTVHIRNVCLLELFYGCGMRRGEAERLDLADVDLAERTVIIRESKWAQTRVLPLMGTAIIAVKDYLALRRELLRGPDRGAFFLVQTGERLDGGAIAAIFRKVNQDRGPEARHLHPHLLRHSIAVHLVRGGADIRHVQAFLGHGDLNTTKVYLRMVPGRLKADYEQAMPEIAVGVES